MFINEVMTDKQLSDRILALLSVYHTLCYERKNRKRYILECKAEWPDSVYLEYRPNNYHKLSLHIGKRTLIYRETITRELIDLHKYSGWDIDAFERFLMERSL